MTEPFEPPSGAAPRYKNSRKGGAAAQPQEEIACAGGTFSLPAGVFGRLEGACTAGLVYLRQDEDTLTISPVRLADGRKRQLNNQYRIPMFRTATRLAVLELGDTVLLMPVRWRPFRGRTEAGSRDDVEPRA